MLSLEERPETKLVDSLFGTEATSGNNGAHTADDYKQPGNPRELNRQYRCSGRPNARTWATLADTNLTEKEHERIVN
jgi:hypothetical protein